MNKSIHSKGLILLTSAVLLLTACNSDSEGSSGDDHSTGDDQNTGGQTPSDQLRAITKDNKLFIAQFVYRRMYWNDLGSWGTTTDDRDAYLLANLARLHNDYTTQSPDATLAEGDSLASLCPSSGDVIRSETEEGGFLFTYDDCRWTTYFGNNRHMDGTLSLEPYSTEYNEGWIVGLFFDYGTGTQYRGELTYEYNSDSDYRISNINVTVEGEFGSTRYDDVELERTPASAFFSGNLYFEDEYTNEEDNGTLTASTNGINRLDSPTTGQLIIEGADGNTLTIQFKQSGVDIQFNDETPESYSDSAFDPRA
ncbi:MAG: hypothetical protein LAT65_13070 [Saccharospirillum sp.]|nr:hypothetical protein [Saccharospirillum sp.]